MSAPPAASLPQHRAFWGVALVLGVALAFSSSIILARLIYRAGGDALTLLAARYVATAAVLYLVFRLRGETPWLPRALTLPVLGIGLMVGSYAYGYLGSIQYIPVSLAVLIFYTNPLWVALLARLIERERLRPARRLALAFGFAGVALAIGVDVSAFDWRGLALAVYAAIGLALTVTASQRVMRRSGSLAVTFHVNLVAAVVYLAAVLVHGPALPSGELGWSAFAVAPFLFALGATGYFAAIARHGGVKTTTLMNAEPVLTVLAAVLVLGESLAPSQVLGACLVLTAIVLVSRRERRGSP